MSINEELRQPPLEISEEKRHELQSQLAAAQAERDVEKRHRTEWFDKWNTERVKRVAAQDEVFRLKQLLTEWTQDVPEGKPQYDELEAEVERLKAVNRRIGLLAVSTKDRTDPIEQAARALEDRLQDLADMAVAEEPNLGIGDLELCRRQVVLLKSLEAKHADGE